jgi:hypothetical protein
MYSHAYLYVHPHDSIMTNLWIGMFKMFETAYFRFRRLASLHGFTFRLQLFGIRV